MSELSSLLLASLQPQTRKAAEQKLLSFSNEPNALPILLQFVLQESQDKGARLAGSTLLKNTIKRRWYEDQDEPPVAPAEKTAIRSNLLPAMVALSKNASDKALLGQINAIIALVAENDFPGEWPDLVQSLASLLSPTDVATNNSILETAHSIFSFYRSAIRSDDLYTIINLVLEQFLTPFLALFRAAAAHILSQPQIGDAQTAKTMSLLTFLFYDLVCQDLPPAIEDAHAELFASPNGIFIRLLNWSPPNLLKSADDTDVEPSMPSQIKSNIFELLELYIKRYNELFSPTDGVNAYVDSVWKIVSASSAEQGPISDNAMVSQALRFMATAIRSGSWKALFSSDEVISRLIQGVIIPNVSIREHEIEQFEDDPMEYIRVDLSPVASASAEGSTRRQSAADVLRAFVELNPTTTTNVVGEWINQGLREYQSNPSQNWKAKDTAIYLVTAVATRGATSQHGVTSTNALVDVLEFFKNNVYQDLETTQPAHPLLQVDAIRFLHSFRNQLTKEQLLLVLPLLIRHVASSNYVCSSYAAITIERILFIKQNNLLLFTQADIHDHATNILLALFAKIDEGGTAAEKVAENDYLMKCIMRVIITARYSLVPVHEGILNKLITILAIISKNPSNPNFAQYTFESISALIRFTVAGKPETLSNFEGALFGAFEYILQQDVEEYVPYVFQLLSQLLELRPKGTPIPPAYSSLLPLLTTPALWQQKGSVPGLVRLLKAFLAKDALAMKNAKQLDPIAGVLVQRLIPSKLNDVWGFDLLEGFLTHVPTPDLTNYYKPLLIALLTRMNNNRTDRFAYSLARFFALVCSIEKPGDTTFSPDYTIGLLESVQAGLWSMLLKQVILEELPRCTGRDRRLAAVGLTRILTRSQLMIQPPTVEVWPTSFETLVKLFSDSQILTKGSKDPDADLAVTQIDFEEQSAGYQAAYSKLSASEGVAIDPISYVPDDPRPYLVQGLNKLSAEVPGFQQVLARCNPDTCANFLGELRNLGLAI